MSIKNYKIFLESIDSDLNKIFDYQKEYIFCKEGCAHCCKNANFPMSELEFEFLMLGYNELSSELKNQIQENIKVAKSTEDKDHYDCPFLINNKCSVYYNRPLVCRAFGVLTQDAKGIPSFPFCTTIGLNFSQIYDENKKGLSVELYDKGNFKVFPKIFRLSNSVIMNLPYAKELGINWGEAKRMVDFL